MRRILYGIGVERVFFFYLLRFEKIEVIRRGKVRRVKFYYICEKIGKVVKIKEFV